MTNELKVEIKIRKPAIILFLAMFFVTIDLLSNVLVLKQVRLGEMLQPGGIFIYPLIYILSDVIAEVYGYKVARLIIIYDIILTLLYSVLAYFFIHLPSPESWHHQQAYNQVLGHLVEVSGATIIAVFAGSIINIWLFNKWRVLLNGKQFWLRSIGSSAIGQAVMLIISAVLVFHSRLSWHEIALLIMSDYIFRMVYIILGVFPANYLANILKAYEGSANQPENKLALFNPFDLKQYK